MKSKSKTLQYLKGILECVANWWGWYIFPSSIIPRLRERFKSFLPNSQFTHWHTLILNIDIILLQRYLSNLYKDIRLPLTVNTLYPSSYPMIYNVVLSQCTSKTILVLSHSTTTSIVKVSPMSCFITLYNHFITISAGSEHTYCNGT